MGFSVLNQSFRGFGGNPIDGNPHITIVGPQKFVVVAPAPPAAATAEARGRASAALPRAPGGDETTLESNMGASIVMGYPYSWMVYKGKSYQNGWDDWLV